MNPTTEVIVESEPVTNELAVRKHMSVMDEVGSMLRAVVEKGVTTENVEAMKELVGLYERMDAKQAERDFNAGFVRLQRDLPVIVAKTQIPKRGKYERFEDVMDAVAKPLLDHGFSVSFDQEPKEGRISVTCILRHISGHSQRNSFTVRLGGNSDSETQADCKASTTAKRNALLAALNIIIRQDCLQDEDDLRNDGTSITEVQAEDLMNRVRATGSDEVKFLTFAKSPLPSGATPIQVIAAYRAIPSSMLLPLHDVLRSKERAK